MKYAEKINLVYKSGAEDTQLRNLYFIFIVAKNAKLFSNKVQKKVGPRSEKPYI
tara:strand:+ start:1363 stop:1524 length:162 start_codon:yes stop_codon:yes gene_type:complete